MSGALIVLGILLVVGYAVWYVWRNPQVLGQAASTLHRTERAVEAGKIEFTNTAGSTYNRPNTREASITEQFRDLHVREIFKYDDQGGGSVTGLEYTVTGVGYLAAQNRKGQNYTDKGVNYRVIAAKGLFFMERPEGWYLLTEEHNLPGEEIDIFDEAGKVFGEQYGQMPRSHSFNWRNQKFAMLDAGYVYVRIDNGAYHIPNGTLVKYTLSESADGATVIFSENTKNTPKNRAWTGRFLGTDLDGYITHVLRASA